MMRTTNIMAMSAAAVLLMASCSKDQVTQTNPGDAIRFNALTGSATKATEVTAATSLPNFQVYARYAASTSLNFDELYTNANYPNGLPENGAWTSQSGNTHYWPNDANEQVTFFAYSPSDFASSYGNPTITPPANSSATFTVNNIVPPLHASEQKDLLIAQKAMAKPASGTAVALNFQHVFSQIALQALCGDQNMKVTVYGAKIYGFGGSSSLTWKSTDTEINAVWTGTSTTKTTAYMVGGSDVANPVVLGSSASPIMGTNGTGDGNVMVIPQNLNTAWDYASNGGAYIAVLCKIERNNGTAEEPIYEQVFPTNSQMKCGFTAVPLSQNFERGKKYTFTLQFFTSGGGGGVTPPDPTDPTDPEDPDIDQTDPNKPVLAPMTFTIAVTDWNTGTTTATNGNLPLQ